MTTTMQVNHGEKCDLVRTARITGLFYWGMIVCAVFGYFIVPAQIFDPGNAAATLRHLTEHALLAKFGLAMELCGVSLQALLALWFYRMFRDVDNFLAVAILVLGMINSVVLFASVALHATALNVALDPSLGGAAATAQMLYAASGNLWKVVAVPFGLWLIPMGLLVLRSGWMPRLMGWLLIVGGIGYVINAFLLLLAPGLALVASVLALPSVSEFWMAGYLLTKGVRRTSVDD